MLPTILSYHTGCVEFHHPLSNPKYFQNFFSFAVKPRQESAYLRKKTQRITLCVFYYQIESNTVAAAPTAMPIHCLADSFSLNANSEKIVVIISTPTLWDG